MLHTTRYYDLCNHAANIGFISGPRAEIFHLAERFLQGLSSNRYVMDDEEFKVPSNVKAHYVKVSELGRLNDYGVGGARDAEERKRKQEAREKALQKAKKVMSGQSTSSLLNLNKNGGAGGGNTVLCFLVDSNEIKSSPGR